MGTKRVSFFFLTVGILCVFLFVTPFFRSIINLGNLTGMGISILLIIYGLFFSCINRAIGVFWKKRIGKILLSLTALFGSIILLLSIIITSCMVSATAKQPPENTSTTAIILGCAVHGRKPSLMLQSRLDAALTYLEENPSANAVLSGGKGPGENITEARCMLEYLTSHGISEERLYLEERSENTLENIQYSKEILQKLPVNNDVVIITNEFHQYRAGLLAKDAGLNPYSINGKTIFYLLPTYYVRELYAVLKQWIL